MDDKHKAVDGQEPEVVRVESMEPAAEASVLAIAEAATDSVVARAPKKGRGLAALFTRKPHAEPEVVEEAPAAEPEDADAHSPEDILPHKNGQLNSVLECMLFVSGEPMTAKELAETLEIEEARVEEAMDDLEQALESRGGLQLMRVAGGYQLCTRPEYADYCAMLLTPAKKKLSKAALETLAVVAYRQPCTMPEVEAVRGVSVDGVMKTLMERGLVREAGRKQTPGRPILYATTPEFLEYFGLNDISELPDIDMLAVEQVRALEAQRELFTSEEVSDPEEMS
ncbi:MAG: SMC-Scp complex subunit ScpB [Armatimonadetes bacterium]|nr:SMC-Scp complex subunit ScpB [Armatimonadota bacterium]